jgi:hypothetical protein
MEATLALAKRAGYGEEEAQKMARDQGFARLRRDEKL